MRKLKNYKPTCFMAEGSYYDKDAADHAVCFIEKFCCHTKGTWDGKPFELIDWQEQIEDEFMSKYELVHHGNKRIFKI